MLYAPAIAVAGLLSTVMWGYACWPGKLADTHEAGSTDPSHGALLTRFAVVPIMFGLAIIFVFTVPTLWAARSIAFAAPLLQIVIAGYQYRHLRRTQRPSERDVTAPPG